MGLTLSEFYSMSERQFGLRVEGYNLQRARAFEHTRAVCYYIAAVNRDPKKSFPTMQKFWPLPTDEQTVQEITQSRAARIRELYEKAKNGS